MGSEHRIGIRAGPEAGLDPACARRPGSAADLQLGPTLLRSIPLRRLGEPVECGPAAAMLLSDRVAGYITGADLVVDGGFTCDSSC